VQGVGKGIWRATKEGKKKKRFLEAMSQWDMVDRKTAASEIETKKGEAKIGQSSHLSMLGFINSMGGEGGDNPMH